MNVQVDTAWIILNRRNQLDRCSSLGALEIRLSFYTGDRSSVRQTWSLLLSGGPPLTRMPSQTFNLGHEAARESDHRFSALRNCGKDRREQNVQKKKEGKKERKRKRISVGKFLTFHSVFHSRSLLRRIFLHRGERNPSKLKNLESELPVDVWPFNYPRVDTKYRFQHFDRYLDRFQETRIVSYRIVEWIHRKEDSPCSPRRWTRQSGSLPRVRRTPCTVDSSATQKIIFFPEFVPLTCI